MEIEVLIISIALFLLFIYLVIEVIMTFKKRSTISPITIILLLIGILFAILVHYRGKELIASDWAQILLMIGLVAVTAVYAWSTQRQAKANEKMAEEMRQQRIMVSRPVIIQKAVCEDRDYIDIKIGWTGIIKGPASHFSHFEIYNAGNGPAIDVEISILDAEKHRIDSLDKDRKTFLRANDPALIFSPQIPSVGNKIHYLACEYSCIIHRDPHKMWYQTLLPFIPSKSSEGNKTYIGTGDLEFHDNVDEKDRIDAFTNSWSKND